jgi:uncharacterized protein (DUF302 family)
MMRWMLVCLLLLGRAAQAEELPGILHWQQPQDLETIYRNVYNALEEKHFYVVFEPDIGHNLAGNAERWGDDYNRNHLDGIRSMVFCNGWYANQVSNLDPRLLALCPLHLTVYRQGNATHVVFVRPTRAGAGSQATELLQQLESEVSKAVEQGLGAAR